MSRGKHWFAGGGAGQGKYQPYIKPHPGSSNISTWYSSNSVDPGS